jgi:hypothetical protein
MASAQKDAEIIRENAPLTDELWAAGAAAHSKAAARNTKASGTGVLVSISFLIEIRFLWTQELGSMPRNVAWENLVGE